MTCIVQCPQCKTELWLWLGTGLANHYNFRSPKYQKLPELRHATAADGKFFWCGCRKNSEFLTKPLAHRQDVRDGTHIFARTH